MESRRRARDRSVQMEADRSLTLLRMAAWQDLQHGTVGSEERHVREVAADGSLERADATFAVGFDLSLTRGWTDLEMKAEASGCQIEMELRLGASRSFCFDVYRIDVDVSFEASGLPIDVESRLSAGRTVSFEPEFEAEAIWETGGLSLELIGGVVSIPRIALHGLTIAGVRVEGAWGICSSRGERVSTDHRTRRSPGNWRMERSPRSGSRRVFDAVVRCLSSSCSTPTISRSSWRGIGRYGRHRGSRGLPRLRCRGHARRAGVGRDFRRDRRRLVIRASSSTVRDRVFSVHACRRCSFRMGERRHTGSESRDGA